MIGLASLPKVQDTNVTLKLKLLRLDVISGKTIQSPGLPMAPHSGASLPNVDLPSGDILMHAIFIVDDTEVSSIGAKCKYNWTQMARIPMHKAYTRHKHAHEVTTLLRWSLGNAPAPPRLVGQCTLDARLAALFALGEDVYGVPFAKANRLVKIIPPASRHNDPENMLMEHMGNNVEFINALRDAQPCGQSPLSSPLPAPIYINETEPIPGGGNITLANPAQYAVVGTTFYYADQRNNSIIGLSLPGVQIQANIKMHMALQYETMAPGGGKTLLIGNSARSLLKVL